MERDSGNREFGSRRHENGPVRSYRDLDAWKIGMDLATACYITTRAFPNDELFGLTSQIRRAAASIPANIAEGNGRESRQDYIRFLRIAQGSTKELETHLLLSRRIGLLSESLRDELLEFCDRLGRMLRALIRSLQQSASHQ